MTKTFPLLALGGATITVGSLLFGMSRPVAPAASVSAVPAIRVSAVPQGGPLVVQDFNNAKNWEQLAATTTPTKGIAKAVTAWGPSGTVDTAKTTTASGGLVLKVETTRAAKSLWGARMTSGLLPVHTTETNLGKLTLSFDHSVSAVRPVTVQIESFDAKKKRTGGREGVVYPAAPDFYLRSALELSTMKAFGGGTFKPTDPFVQITFKIENLPAGSADVKPELRIDNVAYASPAFYVSPKGDGKNDGRSEKTAFATPQKAIDAAQPGDIILLMDGTYDAGRGTVAAFRRGGTPAAWIVLKNYPGQHPMLTSTGWNIVAIVAGSKEKPSDAPSLCYLEIRGLHVRGEGDVAKKKYPEAMNKPDSRTNTNGIGVDGRYVTNLPHHLRIADNLVEYCPGGGIGAGESDWVTIENNVSRCNCWTTIYAPSGISLMGATNFDASDNIYRLLVRNNVCYRNETYEIWKEVNHPSDGNGIILDVNQKTAPRPNGSFRGRTLVQSNLCFDNGGSGIHTVKANRVDIIGNTAYLNSASKDLQYSQIYAYGSEDVRIMNNILVAPVADVAAGEKPEPVNASRFSPGVLYSHNLYFGGNVAPTMGDGDVIADPHFVSPSRDVKTADFHLQPDSPAVGKGISTAFAPFLDLDNKPRKPAPTKGAYEK